MPVRDGAGSISLGDAQEHFVQPPVRSLGDSKEKNEVIAVNTAEPGHAVKKTAAHAKPVAKAPVAVMKTATPAKPEAKAPVVVKKAAAHAKPVAKAPVAVMKTAAPAKPEAKAPVAVKNTAAPANPVAGKKSVAHAKPVFKGPPLTKAKGEQVLAQGNSAIFKAIKAEFPAVKGTPPKGSFMKEAAAESKAIAKKTLKPPKSLELGEARKVEATISQKMEVISRLQPELPDKTSSQSLGEGMGTPTNTKKKFNVLKGYKPPPVMPAKQIAEYLDSDLLRSDETHAAESTKVKATKPAKNPPH